ncbi:Protein FMP25, mitochondrial [Pichia kudriavzevii]|uniref:Protein FMP25, mitochondrial n=1 Tax=Pichia kudriavzevii TaxID=4909 RepID=A0A1V2LUV0_PICKU|nr:Protein FMP25, mitochondrial [Pichia kudriavzevii]
MFPMRTFKATYADKAVSLRLLNRRILHTTAVRLAEEDAKNAPKSTTDIEDDDTLKHLYKRKYQFVQKQNLEDPYNVLHESQHQSNSYGEHQNSSQSDDEKTFQLTQRLKFIAGGVAALVITLGSLEVYNNWSFLKSKYFGNGELESFDEMYERIKNKKQKKKQELELFAKTITNPNDSSVPGVYVCGDNRSQLVSDEKDYQLIPVFKRIDAFDNMIVKDVAIGDKSGALIDERGSLYQWGAGFGGDPRIPSIKGKNLKKVQISNDTVYVLSEKGDVFYLPESHELQNQHVHKQKGWFGSYDVKFQKLDTLKRKIVDIRAGSQHLVLLDDKGKVATTATGYDNGIEQSYGQFGLPEFSQFDAPPRINEIHDVVLLNRYLKNGKVAERKITQIAAGDFFTLCLDQAGSVWAFGKNTYGAIGSTINFDTEIIPYPTQVKFISSHFKRSEFPRCVSIAAGGESAYATFSSSNMYELFERSLKDGAGGQPTFEPLGEVEESKLHLSWGHGLKGELGLGHFIHGSSEPKKIKVLNDIKEYNEITNKLEKIGIKSWSAGKNHVVVTLQNNDVYVWGDNEFGQLGNGKRIRAGAPINIPSLLEPSDREVKYSRFNDRLQLIDNGKVHQEIVAGNYTTAIVYKKD